MGSGPKITGIEVHQFKFAKEDIARTEDGGIAYSPGARSERTGYALRIITDTGPSASTSAARRPTTPRCPPSSTS